MNGYLDLARKVRQDTCTRKSLYIKADDLKKKENDNAVMNWEGNRVGMVQLSLV